MKQLDVWTVDGLKDKSCNEWFSICCNVWATSARVNVKYASYVAKSVDVYQRSESGTSNILHSNVTKTAQRRVLWGIGSAWYPGAPLRTMKHFTRPSSTSCERILEHRQLWSARSTDPTFSPFKIHLSPTRLSCCSKTTSESEPTAGSAPAETSSLPVKC